MAQLALGRYFRLYLSFARYCLVRELGFRINFLARCITQVFWLFLLVFFFELVFLRTKHIGEWTRDEYLFFMGTGILLNAIVDSLFLENCTNLSELIRTGNLDFALLKPIDEQFLLSLQRVDWSTLPRIVVGIALVLYSSARVDLTLSVGRVCNYTLQLFAGAAILYALLLIMAASSVWIIRNRGLYEMWFYVTQFARYPAEIYQGSPLAIGLRFTLMFLLPVLLAVNVPARYGAKLVSWEMVGYLFTAAAVLFLFSRWFLHFALKHYRSASS